MNYLAHQGDSTRCALIGRTRVRPLRCWRDRPATQIANPTVRTEASDDERHAMEAALDEAALASGHDDVPVGAVVLLRGEVIARRHNEREIAGDPTAHAEVLALRDAARITGSWRLDEATLVVTLEPCPMCAGAAVAARVRRLVFGAPDLKAGACGSLYNICCDPRLNHEVDVVPHVEAERAALLLSSFFEGRR